MGERWVLLAAEILSPLFFCFYTTCYLATLLPCYLATFLPCYLAALLPCYLATLVIWYLGTLVPCYLGTLLPWYVAKLVPCCLGTLVPWLDPPCKHILRYLLVVGLGKNIAQLNLLKWKVGINANHKIISHLFFASTCLGTLVLGVGAG